VYVNHCHFFSLAPDDLKSANAEFRKLVSLLTRVTLFADVFSSYAYAQSRSTLSLVSGLLSEEASSVVSDLGALHRACIWENIVLKSTLVQNGLLPSRLDKSSSADNGSSVSQTADLLNESGTLAAVPGLEQAAQDQKPKDPSNKETPQQRNAKALKHISTDIPTSLTPFFQGTVFVRSCFVLV
jgi:E3 ubiquitin-protein ligase HUWE1